MGLLKTMYFYLFCHIRHLFGRLGGRREKDVQQEREGAISYQVFISSDIKQVSTILDYLGLSWAISGNLWQSWAILDYLGLSRTISDYLRLSRTISDYLGLSDTISDFLKLSLTILDYL